MSRPGGGPSAVECAAIDRTPDPALTARFADHLARLWPEGESEAARLGLAVSGGADSLALLLLAAAALPGRVEAATVDHGLRPESATEAAQVAAVCAARGIAHETLAIRVPEGNLQDRARAARYAALGAWCARRGLAALATGHQRDDQAETLAMRLNRGSGLAGLAGVRGRALVPGTAVPLLRPLLGWSRAELGALVRDAGLAPAQDPSNEDSQFERVRIRRALADADWLDAGGWARSAALLGEAEAYLSRALDAAWSARVAPAGDGLRLTPSDDQFETVELARRIVESLGGAPSRSEAAGLVARLRQGRNASLGGVLARSDGASWFFAREPARRG